MQKCFKIIALALVLCTLFSGCTTSRHLKDLVIVEGMGIDKEGNEISLMIQTLNVGINNASQTPQGNMTVNTEKSGVTVTQAITNLSKALSKRIFFGQNKLIVIGRELAEENFADNLDYFMRSADSRSDVAVCISDAQAKEILKSKENDASVPCENILYLINNNEKSGLCALASTALVINLYADKTSDIYIPVVQKKEKESVSTKGIGLFSDDKLVYTTNDDETTGFVLITDKANDVSVEAYVEKLGRTGVKISNIKCKKAAYIVNGRVVFDVNIKADMIVDEIENGVTGKITEQDSQKICESVEKRIVQLCEKAYYACRDNKSDSLRVGEYLAANDTASYNRMSDNWTDEFVKSQIKVQVKIELKKLSDNTQVE